MTVEELTNIFLRLEMADKAKDSEFLFGSSEEGVDPFPITGVILDDEGDVCLEALSMTTIHRNIMGYILTKSARTRKGMSG